MAIIYVPDYKEIKSPLIFLAGPIQGAEDWQEKAIKKISESNPGLSIASPRGDYSKRKFDYNTQVDWETYHLNQAAKTGTILFWLAKEKEHICSRAYAQTTRFELSEWATKQQVNKDLKLAIGIEPGFSGERYIRRRLNQDYPPLPIHSTLDKVCEEAIKNL